MRFTHSPIVTFLKSIGNPSSSGYVLLSALVFTSVLLVISSGLVTYSNQYSSFERHSVADAQALQIAEGGIDKAIYELNQNTSYTGESGTALPGGTLTISIATVGSDKRITATGYVPNSTNPTATRVVKATATIGNTNVAFHYGVQAGEGGFVMDGGSQINGSVYANGDIQATNGVTITGAAVAANPLATSTDQTNDSPTPISSCTSSTCINFGDSTATQDFAQSFQTSVAQPMNYIEFYIKKTGAPSDETVRIVNDNSGAPGTDVVMSGTLSASAVTTSFGWVKVTMPTVPILDPGQTYWIVIDGASNASKYYTIGANSSYANGAAKIGQYSSSWSNTSPAGLDGYFRMYLGGGTSFIGGGTYVGALQIGATAADEVWANFVKGTNAVGTIYCKGGNTNNKACNTSRSDPTPSAMPLSDGNIQDWKDDAVSGGTQTGNVTVGFAGATMGPQKIVGNLTVNGGGTLTLSGTLWVTGNITVTGGGKVRLAAAYGANDGALVTDGYVTVNGGATFSGSGTSGSYPFLITTSSCPADPGCAGNPAVTLSGGAGTVAIVAQDGTVNISGGSALKAVTARQVYMTGGAELIYDTGLVNSSFYSGPGGSYALKPGTYVITQ